jgi:hypothetical protein
MSKKFNKKQIAHYIVNQYCWCVEVVLFAIYYLEGSLKDIDFNEHLNESHILSLLGEATGLIGLKLKGCRTTNKC